MFSEVVEQVRLKANIFTQKIGVVLVRLQTNRGRLDRDANHAMIVILVGSSVIYVCCASLDFAC